MPLDLNIAPDFFGLNDTDPNSQHNNTYKHRIIIHMIESKECTDSEIIEYFCDNYKDIRLAETAIWQSYLSNRRNLIEFIIDKIPDEHLNNVKDNTGTIGIIHRAVEHKDYHIIEKIFKRGIDHDIKRYTNTFLIEVCRFGDLRMWKIFDTYCSFSLYQTFEQSIKYNNEEIIIFLIFDIKIDLSYLDLELYCSNSKYYDKICRMLKLRTLNE